ncbi:hypothetical protein C2E23DRAFT_895949, partial [Lenzites betulinus]
MVTSISHLLSRVLALQRTSILVPLDPQGRRELYHALGSEHGFYGIQTFQHWSPTIHLCSATSDFLLELSASRLGCLEPLGLKRSHPTLHKTLPLELFTSTLDHLTLSPAFLRIVRTIALTRLASEPWRNGSVKPGTLLKTSAAVIPTASISIFLGGAKATSSSVECGAHALMFPSHSPPISRGKDPSLRPPSASAIQSKFRCSRCVRPPGFVSHSGCCTLSGDTPFCGVSPVLPTARTIRTGLFATGPMPSTLVLAVAPASASFFSRVSCAALDADLVPRISTDGPYNSDPDFPHRARTCPPRDRSLSGSLAEARRCIRISHCCRPRSTATRARRPARRGRTARRRTGALAAQRVLARRKARCGADRLGRRADAKRRAKLNGQSTASSHTAPFSAPPPKELLSSQQAPILITQALARPLVLRAASYVGSKLAAPLGGGGHGVRSAATLPAGPREGWQRGRTGQELYRAVSWAASGPRFPRLPRSAPSSRPHFDGEQLMATIRGPDTVGLRCRRPPRIAGAAVWCAFGHLELCPTGEATVAASSRMREAFGLNCRLALFATFWRPVIVCTGSSPQCARGIEDNVGGRCPFPSSSGNIMKQWAAFAPLPRNTLDEWGDFVHHCRDLELKRAKDAYMNSHAQEPGASESIQFDATSWNVRYVIPHEPVRFLGLHGHPEDLCTGGLSFAASNVVSVKLRMCPKLMAPSALRQGWGARDRQLSCRARRGMAEDDNRVNDGGAVHAATRRKGCGGTARDGSRLGALGELAHERCIVLSRPVNPEGALSRAFRLKVLVQTSARNFSACVWPPARLSSNRP